jgi:ferrous iron transport protein A
MDRRLAEMSVGDRGRVAGFKKGLDNYRKKLISMGLIKGTEFTVNRVAPMGDPVEIEVRGYSLSLRKDEATALLVEGM